jgi:hypothetical protein
MGLFVPSSGGCRRDGLTNRLWRDHSLLHPLDAQAAGQSAALGHLADRTQSSSSLVQPNAVETSLVSALKVPSTSGFPVEPRLRTDDPVDVVRHGHIFVGDAALGVRHQRESHRPPTDIDVGVMILRFGVLSHPAHRIDTCEECRKLDRPAQRALRPLPSVEVRQCGVNLLIR